MRNKRFLLGKENSSPRPNSRTFPNETPPTTIEIVHNRPQPSISQQIKSKQGNQRFMEAFQEFDASLQEQNGQVLFQEFEKLTGFNALEAKVEDMFLRASGHFKIAVISELDDDHHIQILRELERKLCKKSDVMLEVIKCIFCLLINSSLLNTTLSWADISFLVPYHIHTLTILIHILISIQAHSHTISIP